MGLWAALPSMLQARERPGSACVGGSLYVCGGVEKAGCDRVAMGQVWLSPGACFPDFGSLGLTSLTGS